MTNIDELLTLIQKHCTGEQVAGVLRLSKEHKDVRISAESKEQLINRNLREAILAKAVPIE